MKNAVVLRRLSSRGGAVPETAMLLAAGRGERMRPLTDTTPKPMLEVDGKPVLDHALDKLDEAGVRRVCVNTCYLGHVITDHLAERTRPEVLVSPEDEALETGGGIKRALSLLGTKPFVVANGDSLWVDGMKSTVQRLAEAWDDTLMDVLLMVISAPRIPKHQTVGDYRMDPVGRLTRRAPSTVAPFVYIGLSILHPRALDDTPDGPFSLNLVYDRAEKAGRLFGITHDGLWYHVSTPSDLEDARRRFANGHAPDVPFF